MQARGTRRSCDDLATCEVACTRARPRVRREGRGRGRARERAGPSAEEREERACSAERTRPRRTRVTERPDMSREVARRGAYCTGAEVGHRPLPCPIPTHDCSQPATHAPCTILGFEFTGAKLRPNMTGCFALTSGEWKGNCNYNSNTSAICATPPSRPKRASAGVGGWFEFRCRSLEVGASAHGQARRRGSAGALQSAAAAHDCSICSRAGAGGRERRGRTAV